MLKETGWMHNRPRMVTASFLTKDLLINWQNGERYYMQHLVDGDMASNNGGWQWAAAQAPTRAILSYFQSGTFKHRGLIPTGTYIRRWVPELERCQTGISMRPGPCPTPWRVNRKFNLEQTIQNPLSITQRSETCAGALSPADIRAPMRSDQSYSDLK